MKRFETDSKDGRSAWETGSPRGLSRAFLFNAEECTLEEDIVVIQDRFEFNNFCHFIYDAVTRISHYLNVFGYTNELFVLGGIPGAYQEIIINSICKMCRVPVEGFLFPNRRLILTSRRKIVWFSDQKELHAHPAQMAHPSSLRWLRRISDATPQKTGTLRRIYISRADAERRRVYNEDELQQALEKAGFTTLQLATLSVEEQIEVFKGAEVVVGAHGMGLTNIIMGPSIGRVVELFHPFAGTDAYAQVALSLGINYSPVLGQDVAGTPSDFSVDTGQILSLVNGETVRSRRINPKKSANLIPTSRTFKDFSSRSPEPRDRWPGHGFYRMISDQETCVHWKQDPPTNSNVGRWANIAVIGSELYCASCWLWLPGSFQGSSAELRIEGGIPVVSSGADTKMRGNWQRIFMVASVPMHVKLVSVSLHIAGPTGTGLVSTAWQLERGTVPTAYVATG